MSFRPISEKEHNSDNRNKLKKFHSKLKTLSNKFPSILPRLFYPVLLVSLFFGLWPKGYDFKNHASWAQNETGLVFGKYGIAYTEPILSGRHGENLALDIGMEVAPSEPGVFSHIVTLHEGENESQIVVGQWADTVIVMIGNDYENRLHLPRLAIPMKDFKPGRNRLYILCNRKNPRPCSTGGGW